ncbi:MAG: NUDIX domain-containing protein [Patescibacteria group bacterium]
MQKYLIKLFKRPTLEVVKLYWRIFRPETFGVKIILTHSNSILLVKHTYGYNYTFPGGGIKKDEDKLEGVKREVKEELGIQLSAIHYVGHLVSTRFYKKDNIFIYTSELFERSFTVDALEIESANWFGKNSLPKLSLTTQDIYDLYLKVV